MELEDMTPEDWAEANAMAEEAMDYSPLGSLNEDKAEIRRLRAELEREQRARGLEQLDMVRLESEVERLQRLIGEAYAKRGPNSSQALRSLFGQARRGSDD